MNIRLKELEILETKDNLKRIPSGKVLINTINAHSYNIAQKDMVFAAALKEGGYLIPDGVSIVKACKWLHAKSQPKERIAGWDLFVFEMEQLSRHGGKVMFVGSSPQVLQRIKARAAVDYPKLDVEFYSPPYKEEFSEKDNQSIVQAIEAAAPDLLWIGMTAPKQEKWAYMHWKELEVTCHVGTVGAVFDFYAGTSQRAPDSWQRYGLEWLYRLLKEPKRMWRRYLIGNPLFVWNVIREKYIEKTK